MCVAPLISSVRPHARARALVSGDVAAVQSDRSGMAAAGHIEMTGTRTVSRLSLHTHMSGSSLSDVRGKGGGSRVELRPRSSGMAVFYSV